MKYNEEHDRFIDDDLVVYRWNKNKDKLIQCCIGSNGKYKTITTKKGKYYLHRFVYETFVGKIPSCMEIDHIDTNKNNNSLDNLRLATKKENMNNPLTLKHRSDIMKGKLKGRKNPKMSLFLKGNTRTKGKTFSDFAKKFKEHYNMTHNDNKSLYYREYHWYKNHNNKCRWEKPNEG